MKYNKFTMQLTIEEDGKQIQLEPLTYRLKETQKITHPKTGEPDTFMKCVCEETGEMFYITEKTCEDFEKEGIITVL